MRLRRALGLGVACLMIAPWICACSARSTAPSAASSASPRPPAAADPAATAAPSAPAEAEPAPSAWTRETTNGRYALTLRPETTQIPIGPIHRWIVEVRSSQGTLVEDASIVVGGGMEGHGHGLPTSPKVTGSPSAGVYVIDGMKFSMAGEWTLTLRVESGGMPDSAKFLIDVAY